MRNFLIESMAVLMTLCSYMIAGHAQETAVKSGRLEKVGSGAKIELKVGETVSIYSDTDDIVDYYDAAFDGAYLNAAYVFFSDGTTTHSDSKYVRISHTNPQYDLNELHGLKPTPGYVDLQYYYVIAYWDSRGTTRIASGEYPFKVKVVGENGEESSSLQKLSLPEEITIYERHDYLLTPSIKPSDAVTKYYWDSSDQSVVFTLAGDTAIELGQGKYFSENVSLYVSEKDCFLRARDPGTATVTVTTDEGLKASVKVNVIPYELHKYDLIELVDDIFSIVDESLNR